MARLEKINELIQHKLAELINRELELPNVLLTVSFAKCSEDLNFATIGVSVLPEGYSGTALKALRKKSGNLSQLLKKQTNLPRVPKLNFIIDATESKAAIIEEIISEEEKEIAKIHQK